MSVTHKYFRVNTICLSGSPALRNNEETGPCMYNFKKTSTFDQGAIDTSFTKAF